GLPASSGGTGACAQALRCCAGGCPKSESDLSRGRGDWSDVELCRPVLPHPGQRAERFGPNGRGARGVLVGTRAAATDAGSAALANKAGGATPRRLGGAPRQQVTGTTRRISVPATAGERPALRPRLQELEREQERDQISSFVVGKTDAEALIVE